MFNDHQRICCRSQDSAGKGPSRHHILEDQENSRKIPENYILPKDSGSQKEKERRARGSLMHRGRGLAPGHAGPV
jgi:hypothetical protein